MANKLMKEWRKKLMNKAFFTGVKNQTDERMNE